MAGGHLARRAGHLVSRGPRRNPVNVRSVRLYDFGPIDEPRPTKYFAGMRKPFTLLTSAVCLAALLSFIPAAPGQAPDAAAKLEALSTQLQLTPQQKGEMLPILKEEGPKIEAIKNNTSLSGTAEDRSNCGPSTTKPHRSCRRFLARRNIKSCRPSVSRKSRKRSRKSPPPAQ